MNSMACSRFSMRGGTSRMASSAVDARMLVSFFSLTMFTSRSASRAFSPTIMPSYTSVPGATKISPRSCRLKMACPVVLPGRSATSELQRQLYRLWRRPAKHDGGPESGVAADVAQRDQGGPQRTRSEEHTSELQSLRHLV